MKKLMVALLVATLASCSSMDPKLLKDPSIRVPNGAFSLELGVLNHKVRKVLVGSQYPVMVTPRGGLFGRVEYQDRLLTQSGVYIGNGIFIDSNRNVVFDVLKFYGLSDVNYLKVVTKDSVYYGKGMVYERNGQSAKEQMGDFESNTSKFSDSEVEYESKGVLNKKVVFRKSENNLTEEGVFGANRILSALVKKSETEIQFPEPQTYEISSILQTDDKRSNDINKANNKSLILTYASPKLIKFGQEFSIENKGDHIEISTVNYENKKVDYTFIRTAKGVIFYHDEYLLGFQVIREGSLITIINNGSSKTVYRIE